jgi:hypothetical protein
MGVWGVGGFGQLFKRTPKNCKYFFRKIFPLPGSMVSGRFLDSCNGYGLGRIKSCPNGFIPPHQFEKTNRVAHGMNLAHLIGVNGRNWD